MEIVKSKDAICVSQRKYDIDLVKDIDLLGCKPIDTPINQNCKLGTTSNATTVDTS